MKLLDLTLDDSSANIALDEALLETAESQETYPEVLRLWEPRCDVVVIGRSSPIETEVNLEHCRQQNIEVFRRCSGGASIVTGRGCLMYALLLDYRKRESLRMLEQAHTFVMQHIMKSIQRIGIETKMQGTCDLTIDDRKFSGNALRCKRNWMIYHGTLLCDFDLQKITDCLGSPKRQPDYRQQRSHSEFLTQLPTDVTSLRQAIVEHFSEALGATLPPLNHWPEKLTQQLAREKYLTDDWNFKVRK